MRLKYWGVWRTFDAGMGENFPEFRSCGGPALADLPHRAVLRGLRMKVRDVMTRSVASCRLETNLAAAGALMWESDCGILPVTDERGRVVSVLTDRDACIALTTRDQRASAVTVGDVVRERAHTCSPEDDIHSVLTIMKNRKIRRVPAVDRTGRLAGIVSLNDIVLHAGKGTARKPPDISYDELVETLRAVCGHRQTKKAAAAGVA